MLIPAVSTWLRQRLSRIISSGQYVPEIDGLRFVAIVWVVAFHLSVFIESRTGHVTSNGLTWLFKQGRLGVPLFFVISGFILAVPFARQYLCGAQRLDLRRYFLRRVTRLEPPYMAQLCVATAILAAAYVYGLVPHLHLTGIQDVGQHALASAVYSHNLIYGDLNPINWVLWSLEVEIQFYILMPLLAVPYRIRSRFLRRWIWLASILTFAALAYIVFPDAWRYQHSLFGSLQYFLCGLLLADVHVTRPDQPKTPAYFWDAVAIPAWISIPFLNADVIGGILLPFAMMFAYSGALWGMSVRRFFQLGLLATIGGMCYTIYLYHYLIILAVGPLTLRLPRTGVIWFDQGVQYIVLSAIVLGLSAIAFAFLEKPFMRPDWPKRFWQWCRSRP